MLAVSHFRTRLLMAIETIDSVEQHMPLSSRSYAAISAQYAALPSSPVLPLLASRVPSARSAPVLRLQREAVEAAVAAARADNRISRVRPSEVRQDDACTAATFVRAAGGGEGEERRVVAEGAGLAAVRRGWELCSLANQNRPFTKRPFVLPNPHRGRMRHSALACDAPARCAHHVDPGLTQGGTSRRPTPFSYPSVNGGGEEHWSSC